jgi:dCTP deaminase
MILSDRDIAEGLDAGEIVTEPPVEAEQIQPASLDIRMGEEVVDAATDSRVEPTGGTYEVSPRRLYHAATFESVDLPRDLAAQIAGRSSFAREGLVVHLTAGWVDPGWTGRLTMEMVNLGPNPIAVDIGERVAQLVFLKLSSESEGYAGRYQGADGVEGSKR